MRTEEPRPIRAEDYRPPAYRILSTTLDFQLDPERTIVRSTLDVRRNYDGDAARPLRLDGEGLELLSIKLNGVALDPDSYRVDETGLTLAQVPAAFTLDIETAIHPAANTALEGLYQSNGLFCTQCEAEGFRKITYYLDRPDVMATFRTRLTADKALYPVLLSNGNRVDGGDLEGGRHWAEWHDPFPKPSYLFALVAGNLACVADRFVTGSGRAVSLHLYVEPGQEDRCTYALDALKRAMKWDEDVFGREYDLDVFMIVAVSHFNMGAMENKGLNIFNAQYILAKPETATDDDFARIESVVAHEYFHNWTGNRVTCRDWFQLCLKEGLTVFRDQEFSADMRSRAVQRIQDVRALRNRQFPEDAGPLAHPVRPQSYIEINNFYTTTVYEKGAEVVRMLHTLLGPEKFRAGMDLYFERHDGEAATVEDFVQAMEDASGTDLAQFRLWYAQAGTPRIRVAQAYEAASGTYTLTLNQTCPPTPGQPHKQPFHIPVRFALLGRDGAELPYTVTSGGEDITGDIIHLRRSQHIFRFAVPERPMPSLLRGFSAPVRLDSDASPEDRLFLMGHDSDLFTRWDSGHGYARQRLLDAAKALSRNAPPPALENAYLDAVHRTLAEADHDPAFVAEALALPAETDLIQDMEPADPVAIHKARHAFLHGLAAELKDEFLALYARLENKAPYRPDAAQAGCRALRNRILSLLTTLHTDDVLDLAWHQFTDADNMTDSVGALAALTHTDCPARASAFQSFYERWRDDELVIDKWLSLQAISARPDTIERVKALMDHPCFTLRNPNRVRALIGAFAHTNPLHFHDASGAGYDIVAGVVQALDRTNPQLAARLLEVFETWRKFGPTRQALMRQHLETIAGAEGCSKNVFEIATKILGVSPS